MDEMIKEYYMDIQTNTNSFLDLFNSYEKRSMFGGIGIFYKGTMFAIVMNEQLFLRGGSKLDEAFLNENCERFTHIKKNRTAIINYYNVTSIYNVNKDQCYSFIEQSKNEAQNAKERKEHQINRLRDLPNMRLTLERMLKKSGIEDVTTFYELGAVEVFQKVRETHGRNLDIRLLWMFAGAIKGCHWSLLNHQQKEKLQQMVEN